MERQDVDFDARYKVDGFRGVAFYLLGWAQETRQVEVPLCDHEVDEPHDECEYVTETEQVDSDTFVRAVMVGDDTVHFVDVDDLHKIEDGDYCPECGQIGCKAYGLSEI